MQQTRKRSAALSGKNKMKDFVSLVGVKLGLSVLFFVLAMLGGRTCSILRWGIFETETGGDCISISGMGLSCGFPSCPVGIWHANKLCLHQYPIDALKDNKRKVYMLDGILRFSINMVIAVCCSICEK